MKEEIKKKWLKALRSGEYIQGKSYLRKIDNTYCCLGVLCDLYVKEGLGEWKETDVAEDPCWSVLSATGYLPGDVALWAGVESQTGWITLKDGQRVSLTGMNDGGYSFEKIAQKIEEAV